MSVERCAPSVEQLVLLRLATSRDASLARAFLARHAIETQAVDDVPQVLEALKDGAGALLVAEEALNEAALDRLEAFLSAQPPWSDFPVILLTRQGADSPTVRSALARLRNVTVVERPVRMPALLSTVRSALRARARQHEVRRLVDNLRVADERKTEFLATLAHELRNPLAPISTALELLRRHDPDADRAKRLLEMMSRQVGHMVRLVDDLMEVSRITRGKVELQRSLVDLETVVADAVEFSRPLIDRAGHTLVLDGPSEPIRLHADPVRLTQVIVNLLNNAARYTPPGGRLEVLMRRAANDARADAVIEVRDNGVGLQPEMTERVFDMFVQGDGPSQEGRSGLGIGLTLVRALVELHGGSVTARSAGRDAGSTFVVRLPTGAPSRQTVSLRAPSVPADAPALGSILVVDDNRDAADTLAELLSAGGACVHVAYSGRDALRTLDQHAVGAAVLDIGMPEMDGFELARTIRGSRAGAGTTLIALSGWGQASDRALATAAGFDHHLLKPVDVEQLIALLRGKQTELAHALPPAAT